MPTGMRLSWTTRYSMSLAEKYRDASAMVLSFGTTRTGRQSRPRKRPDTGRRLSIVLRVGGSEGTGG
jgi:hypothetical protein